jgi:hypothetical protein
MPEIMTQTALYPVLLKEIVASLEYRPKWKFHLLDEDRGQGCMGLTFEVVTRGYNSYHIEGGEFYGVRHLFTVPAASYNRRSWIRWVFNCLIQVETHEAMEFFSLDGTRPYAPNHGEGNDPYMIFELGTEQDARTSFRNELNPHGV